MSNDSENLKVGYAILAVALLACYVIARVIEKLARKAWELVKIRWRKRSTEEPEVEVVDA